MIELLLALVGSIVALLGVVATLWQKLNRATDEKNQAHTALDSVNTALIAQRNIIKKQAGDQDAQQKTIANRHYFDD